MRCLVFGLVSLVTLFTGCKKREYFDSHVSTSSSVNVEWSNTAYKGKETVLIRGVNGELALAEIGPKMSVKVFRSATAPSWDQVSFLKSFQGKFYIQTLGPQSSIEVLDPKGLEKSETIAIDPKIFKASASTAGSDFPFVGGLVMDTSSTLYMTVPGKSSIFVLDKAKGKFAPWVDLKSHIQGKFGLIEMIVVDGVLLVQVDRLGPNGTPLSGMIAAIDLASKAVKKMIPLTGTRPMPAMDYDSLRKRVWVSCLGTQNRDDGSYEIINVDNKSAGYLSVERVSKLATFEGGVVLGKDFKSIFWNEHTATPSRSTHLHHSLLGKSGTYEDIVPGPTKNLDLTSAFEDSENLQVNTSRDLAAISFRCDISMCPRGAGIYLFDGVSGLPLQKLYAAGRIPPDVEPKPVVTIPFLVDSFTFLRP